MISPDQDTVRAMTMMIDKENLSPAQIGQLFLMVCNKLKHNASYAPDEETTALFIKLKALVDKNKIASAEKQEVLDAVRNSWNSFAKEHGLRTILKITSRRAGSVLARLNDKDFSLEDIFEKIKRSPILLGQNRSGWKVTFSFVFLSSDNYLKILEGDYDDKHMNQWEGIKKWVTE